MITTEIRRDESYHVVLQELVLQATKMSHSHLYRGFDDIFYTLQYCHPYRRFVEFVVEMKEVIIAHRGKKIPDYEETFVSRFSPKSLRVL